MKTYTLQLIQHVGKDLTNKIGEAQSIEKKALKAVIKEHLKTMNQNESLIIKRIA